MKDSELPVSTREVAFFPSTIMPKDDLVRDLGDAAVIIARNGMWTAELYEAFVDLHALAKCPLLPHLIYAAFYAEH